MSSARRHKYVLYGLVGMPLIFALLIPLTSILPTMNADISENQLPPFAQSGTTAKQALVLGVVNLSVLMFMFIPSIIPSVIASYTFVGEKANKQLEPLLATPTTDTELLIGKGLGAFLPTIAATLATFVIMMVVVDLLTLPLFGYLLLPDLISLVVMFVYCPLVAILSISWCVFVSSKVNDVRAATQLSAIGLFPVMVFYFLFIGGIVLLNWTTLVLFAIVLGLMGLGLFLLSKATFKREEILTKWK